MLFDAIKTVKGKPGSPLRSLYLGTLAPSTDGWWHELALSKSGRGRAVLCLQGDREKWDSWREVARVNPLTKVSAEFRKQLRAELKAAVADAVCALPRACGSNPPAAPYSAVTAEWGAPELVVCDRFRLGELQDCVNGTAVLPRVSRWSEAAFDIRAVRRLAKDGPLSVEEQSRPLLAASLAVAMVKNDDQGNTRLVKSGTHNTARDDVAAALTLAAGVYQRARAQPKRASAYLGTA